jgi:hypothetical protein
VYVYSHLPNAKKIHGTGVRLEPLQKHMASVYVYSHY